MKLPSTIAKLLLPKETKAVLACLEVVSQKTDLDFFPEVKADLVETFIRTSSLTKKWVNESGKPIEGLAYWAINLEVTRLLCSGHYHVYRGTLSLPGNDLLKIFYSSLKGVVEFDMLSQEEADERISAIKEEIRAVG